MRLFSALAALAVLTPSITTADIAPRNGWQVIATEMTHAELAARMTDAVSAENMGLVTQAGPTNAARSRGVEIPENLVMGVFRNDYAVTILGLSEAAMIEAPIRFYLTEDADGTARLSWKTPSHVFAPYVDDAGAELAQIAAELDAVFAAKSDRSRATLARM